MTSWTRVGAAGAGLAGTAVYASLRPDDYVRALQALLPVDARPPAVPAWVTRTVDLEYPSAHPNATFDLHRPTHAPGPRPVFLFVHGGGFALGDKQVGRGLTSGVTASPAMIARAVGHGFAVISANYALTPTRRWPVPVLQIGELATHLHDRADDLGLDMSRVVLAGSSAGGHVLAQYSLVQTNPVYAASLGLEPTLPREHLRALYLGCALLDPARISRVTAPGTWPFRPMRDAYFSGPAITDRPLGRASLIEHVDPNFPPTFVADGSVDTFTDQATDLVRRLRDLGVPVGSLIHDRRTGRVGHAYDLMVVPEAGPTLDAMIAFVTPLATA